MRFYKERFFPRIINKPVPKVKAFRTYRFLPGQTEIHKGFFDFKMFHNWNTITLFIASEEERGYTGESRISS